MNIKQKGLLIVLSGPSGVGKGTVRKELFKHVDNLKYSISMTTRQMRPGEENGKDYYFVTKDEFIKRIEKGKFLEHAQFVGNFYGTPLDKIEECINKGDDMLLEIEVNGATQVRHKLPEAVLIFLVPPSKKDLYERLKSRGTEDEEVIQARIQKADSEFPEARFYDYIVVNDKVEDAAKRILEIINAEHSKRIRVYDEYLKMLNK